MVSAYDALTAELCQRAGVDALLVGDSVGMVLLGYPDTTPVTMDEMLHHVRAVHRGAPETFLIGDMPLKGRSGGPRHALESARRFRDAGCDAVKLEWFETAEEAARLIRRAGIPVMGHVGLTPQSAKGSGRFRAKGRDAADALAVFARAEAFARAGAFSVLLECVPRPVAEEIRGRIGIPTVGIGAGAGCRGQILVFHDLTGFFTRYRPRFVRRFARLAEPALRAVSRYASAVRGGTYPGRRHGFRMAPGQERAFRRAAAELSGRVR